MRPSSTSMQASVSSLSAVLNPHKFLMHLFIHFLKNIPTHTGSIPNKAASARQLEATMEENIDISTVALLDPLLCWCKGTFLTMHCWYREWSTSFWNHHYETTKSICFLFTNAVQLPSERKMDCYDPTFTLKSSSNRPLVELVGVQLHWLPWPTLFARRWPIGGGSSLVQYFCSYKEHLLKLCWSFCKLCQLV